MAERQASGNQVGSKEGDLKTSHHYFMVNLKGRIAELLTPYFIATGSEISTLERGALHNTSCNSQTCGACYATFTWMTVRTTALPGNSRPPEFIPRPRPIGRNSWAVPGRLESALPGRPGRCPKPNSLPGSLHKIVSGPRTGWLDVVGTTAPFALYAEQQWKLRSISFLNVDTPEEFGAE